MAASSADIFDQLIKVLAATPIQPKPSAGFQARLNVLLGLQIYYAVAILIFLGLYIHGQRRQGNRIWIFRLVKKAESTRWLMPNVFIVTPLWTLPPAVVLSLFIRNCQTTFIDGKNLDEAFYWRNLVWTMIWYNGFVSSYSILQCVLVSLERPTSSIVPTLLNSGYFVIPLTFLVALFIPAVLAANEWKQLVSDSASIMQMLQAGSAQFQSTGLVNAPLLQQVELGLANLPKTLHWFDTNWLTMLVIWTFGSVVLLGISFSGLSLILKLKRQLSESSSWRSISAVDADGLVDDPVVMSNLDSKSTSNINNQTDEGFDSRTKNLRAMRRLMFDVTIKCFGASAIIAVFIAAMCLLAVERKKVATNWTLVEIGLTLPLWAYGIGVSTMMTLLIVVQIRWIRQIDQAPARGHR